MKLPRQIFAFLLVTIMSTVGAMDLQRTHRSWTSGVIYTDDDTPVYRAISDVERKTELYVFFALDIVNDCNTVIPNLLLYAPDGADRSGYLNLGKFQARVDTLGLVNGVWTASSNEMGDQVIFITLLTDDDARLIREIKTGGTLRVKLAFFEEEKDDIYLNFSLAGSSAAISRVYQLCAQHRDRDRQYFPPENQKPAPQTPKDSDYFL